MGLAFSVGNPSEIFNEEWAGKIEEVLVARFAGKFVLDSDDEACYSDEVAWSGWHQLQVMAAKAVGEEQVPHLLSMEAWVGCYVPAETKPARFVFEGETMSLAVGSLFALLEELERVGVALGLPIEDNGLSDLAEKYLEEDEKMDIQTYAQLLLTAHEAQRRQQTLWVVK